jgi:hypothetical protein
MTQTDIVVRSPDNETQLLVEVKKKVPASSEWATRMRRNLYTHFALPPAKYFLLALPERFYLWTNSQASESVPPDYEVDARHILEPYARTISLPLSELSEFSFELLVQSWLEDLVHSQDRKGLATAQPWVVDSGLYDAIAHGSIKARQKSA